MKDNDIIRRSDVLQLPVYSYPAIKALPAVDAVEVVGKQSGKDRYLATIAGKNQRHFGLAS